MGSSWLADLDDVVGRQKVFYLILELKKQNKIKYNKTRIWINKSGINIRIILKYKVDKTKHSQENPMKIQIRQH